MRGHRRTPRTRKASRRKATAASSERAARRSLRWGSSAEKVSQLRGHTRRTKVPQAGGRVWPASLMELQIGGPQLPGLPEGQNGGSR